MHGAAARRDRHTEVPGDILAGARMHGATARRVGHMEVPDDIQSLEILKDIQAKKTGALFRCALRLGLLSAGRPLDQLDSFAASFGLAFQTADDLRDCIGTRERLGKAPGSDLRREKLTSVSLVGIHGTHTALEKLRQSCADTLNQAEFEPALLRQVTHVALNTDDLVEIS